MTEIELKLALPVRPATPLVRQFTRLPVLAGCDRRRQQLHNIYYDTPDHQLRQQGVVLRLRRVADGASAFWLQTLKTSDGGASALSRRGEWESRLDQPELAADRLADTPWARIDPLGSLFPQLQPCFHTRFTRTCWTLRQADGGEVEIALDQGRIVAGKRREAICELELELKTGQVSDLFDIALQMALVVPVIPSGASKSERGYALAGAASAVGPALPGTPTLEALAHAALQAAWRQFTGQLIAVRNEDDPEPVHQARVAWRRFRSARRLFRPILDVAHTQSLPRLADTYIDGVPRRALAWKRMLQQVAVRAEAARAALRQEIDQPAAGHCLTRVTQWLETHAPDGAAAPKASPPVADARAWALRHLRRQRRALRDARGGPDNEARAHRLRILAKRLRYGVDMLHPLLPVRRAHRWHLLASRLQSDLGDRRDALQAARLVRGLHTHPQIAEFLRGHALATAAAQQQRAG